MRAAAAGAILIAGFAAPAMAQGGIRIEVSPDLYLVDHATSPTNQSGRHTWLGGMLLLTSGRWSGTLQGLLGSLRDTSVSGERDVRVTRLAVRFHAADLIDVGPEIETLRYSADDGVALWRMIGVGASGRTALGNPQVEAKLDVSWLPIATTTGDYPLGNQVRVETVLSYRPHPRIRFGLGYRSEVFTFDQSGNRERISGVLLRCDLRLRSGS